MLAIYMYIQTSGKEIAVLIKMSCILRVGLWAPERALDPVITIYNYMAVVVA